MAITLANGQENVSLRSDRDGGATFAHRLQRSMTMMASSAAGSAVDGEARHPALYARRPNVLAEGLGWGLGLGMGFWVAIGLLLQLI